MIPRCEFCSAPLSADIGRLRGCPKCRAAVFAAGMDRGEVRLQVLSEKGSVPAGFTLDRLQTLTVKQLDPRDFLTVELFRCPFCVHPIVLGNIADAEFDGTHYRILLPQKRTQEVRCSYCNRLNRVLSPGGEPFPVEFQPLKKDSFACQLDQFLNQPPPQPPQERSGCLGLLALLMPFR